ncbi:uncharacterized protein A1O5_04282 [Cladophialophora psammophila CBS 110553]|uniref:Uncharacterized protein n=1 Tax=Cladophialophora psammophila CBS 110553 TaxID=1182543 RepID=W9WYT9_9EURO|nr:uncharacterized protein A1O5_04282 [Cladophialophora psammophila CBS 110553]EXJ73133.1 hypothetical protein A1O5_04282 [Cladophialophora psammophila CBS 110553]
MDDWHSKANEVYNSLQGSDQEPLNDLHRRQTPTSSARPIDTAVPTFIPPPNQDITPELIQQSLSVQPQNTALVGSIIPYFRDGVIQIFLQLDGPVATTLVVNCSTSLPCGTIGLVNPQPNLALVPLVVNQGQGQPQTAVADCQCIAVNIYNPHIVTYWIQKLSDGSVYSILGNNVVMDIDKMNTTQSTALTLTALSQGAAKRSFHDNVVYIPPEKRQLWSVQCDWPCPFYHMNKIKGTDGYCGCMFNDAGKELDARELIEPNLYNSKMTEKACAAMTCFNNGGDATPALFHPFHLTCWCITQPYIDSNPSAWSPSSGTTSF